MEKHILGLEASEEKSGSSFSLEEKALEMAIDEVYQSTGSKWKPWARNARSLRIGEIVLIVDSDTIVPEVSASNIPLWTPFSLLTGGESRIASEMPHENLLNALKWRLSSMNLV